MRLEPVHHASHRRYGKSHERLLAEERRDIAEIRSECLWCDWLWIGPAGEGREAARAHRFEAHPKAAKKMGRPKVKS